MKFASALVIATGLYTAAVPFAAAETPPARESQSDLFTQEGTDPTFEQLKQESRFPIGENSTTGVTGSKVRVNHQVLGQLPAAKNPIPDNISIHTLCNSKIDRPDFAKWTRWYQEDGSTQVFRLFTGETNVRNDRPLAARVEAFSGLNWKKEDGQWHEWEGTYTIVKPHPSIIFQVRNMKNDWPVQLRMEGNGDINVLVRTTGEMTKVAKNMTGKSFVLKVRDNGHDFEVFYNGEKVSSGSFERPKGTNCFRWGIYRGGRELKSEAMIFVTGATFK